MGFFKSVFGRGDRCSKCGRSMKLLQSGTMMSTSTFAATTQGCFQCRKCGRLTCFDCSDNRVPCVCGAHSWVERTYQNER